MKNSAQTAKKFAYGGWEAIPIQSKVYKLERGHPFQRSGQNVVAIPQFKTLTLISPAPPPTTTTVAPPAFTTPVTTNIIQYPTVPRR